MGSAAMDDRTTAPSRRLRQPRWQRLANVGIFGVLALGLGAAAVAGLIDSHAEPGPLLGGLLLEAGPAWTAFRACTCEIVCTEDTLLVRGFARTVRIPRAGVDSVQSSAQSAATALPGPSPTVRWHDEDGREHTTLLVMLSGGTFRRQPWQLAQLAVLQQWAGSAGT